MMVKYLFYYYFGEVIEFFYYIYEVCEIVGIYIDWSGIV